MKTEVCLPSEATKQLPSRIQFPRNCTDAEFIEEHGSGTLRDNKEMGFIWKIQCTAERLAYVFGYGFQAYPADQVLYNDSISECDEKAYTLAGRWMKAYQAKSLHPEDYFELKYLTLKDVKGQTTWEGIGIIVRQTSARCIPLDTLVIAKVCQYLPTQGKWAEPVNFA